MAHHQPLANATEDDLGSHHKAWQSHRMDPAALHLGAARLRRAIQL
jgi:hypothetical protein